MTNEQIYLENLLNNNSLIRKEQKYIKENFNVKSDLDIENGELKIWSEYNNNVDIINAKKYLSEHIDESQINIVYN